MNQSSEFGKLRNFFWPIHRSELPKFLPMGLMMLFILLNYTILRGSKDSMIIATWGSSPIPFLKTYFVLPSAFLFVAVYIKLIDRFTKEQVFYGVIGFFLVFFALFAVVLYPNKDFFHPDTETIVAWKESFPRLQHFISLFGTWSYSVYFVLAELWGSSMISLCFGNLLMK